MKKGFIGFVLSAICAAAVFGGDFKFCQNFPVDDNLFWYPGFVQGSAYEDCPYFYLSIIDFRINQEYLEITVNPNIDDINAKKKEIKHLCYKKTGRNYVPCERTREFEASFAGGKPGHAYQWHDIFIENIGGKERIITEEEYEEIMQIERPKLKVEGNTVITSSGYSYKVDFINTSKHGTADGYSLGRDKAGLLYYISVRNDDESDYKKNYKFDAVLKIVNPHTKKGCFINIPKGQIYTFIKQYKPYDDCSTVYVDFYSVDYDTGDVYMLNLSGDNKRWELSVVKNIWKEMIGGDYD